MHGREIIERVIAREREEMEIIAQYSPIIETYIQEMQPDSRLGMVPKSDFCFLGQADFGRRLKVHSLIERSSKGSLMWSFEPAGFLQMIFIDRGEFDKGHYRFEYEKREFLGEVRCHVFRISPVPKARGARFLGRIWVEDQDLTIVRINGTCRRPIFRSNDSKTNTTWTSIHGAPTSGLENDARARELLKKSPCASDLGKAGLFLAQLQSQSKALKRLIHP